MNRVKQVCGTCGSEDVSCDATARWDMDMQEWQISAIHDGDYCDTCEQECRIKELPE